MGDVLNLLGIRCLSKIRGVSYPYQLACNYGEYSDHADRPTTAKRHPAITILIILWVCAGKSNWLTFTPAHSHKKWIGIQMALLINSFSPVSMAKLPGKKAKLLNSIVLTA